MPAAENPDPSAAPNAAEPLRLTPDERNAMRAFLQRSEVRLSTMHRIALAFIGGAGLLLLIPVFFKDVVDNIIAVLLQQLSNQYPALGVGGGWALTLVLFAALAYPLLLSLSIPLYGVYLLLKDVVHFYFTIYMPGSAPEVLNPTLSLSGLTFWADEAPQIKRAVMRYQYMPHQMDYMIPFSEGRREVYFDTLIHNTEGAIIPPSRRPEALDTLGCVPEEADEKAVRHFNAAFGIARSLDRTLIEDVATTEMTLVRNILYLRRLLLRYIKVLLMFIWTTLISFMILPVLQDTRFPALLVLSVGYLIWSALVMWLVRQPLRWIYRHRYGDLNTAHIDPQLTLLESRIARFCQAAVGVSLLAVLLALVAYALG